MSRKKMFLVLGGIVLIAVLVFVLFMGGKGVDRPITRSQANLLILSCKVNGVYSYHNGEVGLLLKSGQNQPVLDVRREDLEAVQNPICPFHSAAIE